MDQSGGGQREAVHVPVQGAGGPPLGRESHAVPRYVFSAFKRVRW